ncbi:uncharacterized protein LOC143051780 isoform X1 [Mytilus galloprovincialis]|uniref:uncharacterized protein LOC143051780 isoform X1 n=1 Tax=Mytilus galloprovincialis TaxID=29158 RepID=UPI003F7B6EB8
MDLPCVQDRESPSISEANSLDDICFPTDEHEDDNISSPSSSFSRQNKRRRLSPRLNFNNYVSNSKYHIPQFVSSWKLYHAERLHIFYSKCYTETPNDLLNLLDKTIEPFSHQQKYYIERIKSFLKFKSCEPGVSRSRSSVFLRDIYIRLEPVFGEIIKELRSIFEGGYKAKNSNPDYYHIDVLASYRVFEFIEELSILLKLFQDKYNQLQEVAETYYIPLCQSFAQMCHLKVQYGRPTKWINLADQKIVSSVPDLCFFQKGKQLDELVLSKSQILVSVVEVKKDSRQKCEEPPIKIGKCSDEKDEGSCRPEILKDLTESVLGQHAGELLLEIRRKDHVTKVENGVKKFMKPGMVVDGTKVYFTILKMSDNHIEELEKKKKYDDSMDEATIYYAKPLDLLFKEDRDILIDSFMMLNNIDFS